MKDKVIEQIATVFEIPPSEISLDSTPETLKNWDSLRHMKMVLALETAFGIEIPPERIVEMLSVKKVVETVAELAH